MGQRVTFAFHYIIYVPAHATRCNGAFCVAAGKQQSLILCLLLLCISTLYVGAPRNCPWGVLFLKGQRVDGSTGSTGQTGHISMVYVGGPRNCLEGFFFEKVNRSTGQRVNWSTGRRVNRSNGSMSQQVIFTFTILYMIADYARLTPPCCKKHMAYHDTRLTPPLQKAHIVFCSLDG